MAEQVTTLVGLADEERAMIRRIAEKHGARHRGMGAAFGALRVAYAH